ncbi:MAG TPA: adenylate/guanylate cyclase domain-containing protein [Burkholderiales bacterium]|nr:adenylate/guanylate cyclase domain-containing protein [Burkholderiales bacterium]
MTEQKTSMAVLFADVSDSTRLYEALGDTVAFGNVREVIALLKGIAETCEGRVVKTIGDGLMCAFPSADCAARAAADMQKQIASRPPMNSGRQLTIRVGFHFGPVIRDGEDVFGDSVNVAARMAGLALSGQALTDASTVAALSAQLREATRQINALPVKGKAEAVEVHELLWQTSSDRTVIPGRAEGQPASVPRSGPCITLTHRGRETPYTDTIYFGREAAGNHVVVADPMASRRHAKIELRAGRFVLLDQSSNGTYVVLGNNAELQLKREEMILYSSGKFAFGHSTTSPGAEVIEFRCS